MGRRSGLVCSGSRSMTGLTSGRCSVLRMIRIVRRRPRHVRIVRHRRVAGVAVLRVCRLRLAVYVASTTREGIVARRWPGHRMRRRIGGRSGIRDLVGAAVRRTRNRVLLTVRGWRAIRSSRSCRHYGSATERHSLVRRSRVAFEASRTRGRRRLRHNVAIECGRRRSRAAAV